MAADNQQERLDRWSRILRDYTPEVALARLRYSPTPAAMQGGLPRGKPASIFEVNGSNRCEPNALSGKFRRA